MRVGVVGGGVLGVSTAIHLARGGASVVLVERRSPDGSASGRSLSWLNSAGSSVRRLPRGCVSPASTATARCWPAPPTRRDLLRFDGGLTWAQARQVAPRATPPTSTAIGYDSVWLAPDEIAGMDSRRRRRVGARGRRDLQPGRGLGRPAAPRRGAGEEPSPPPAAHWSRTPGTPRWRSTAVVPSARAPSAPACDGGPPSCWPPGRGCRATSPAWASHMPEQTPISRCWCGTEAHRRRVSRPC